MNKKGPDISLCGDGGHDKADPPPFTVFGPEETDRPASPFFLVSDHAGCAIPARLGDMGLSAEDRRRHIAWDIGIREVGRRLQAKFNAILIEQNYSRLVIDCNRAPSHPESIPPVSDLTRIPANQALDHMERADREAGIFHPYHNEVEKRLRRHCTEYGPVAFISLHSFTPEMGGQKRPWHIGLLHDHDPNSAAVFRDVLLQSTYGASYGAGLCIGDNEPYRLSPSSEYTVPHHAAPKNLPTLEIEIRQDLIASSEGQQHWAGLLAELLPLYWAALAGETLEKRRSEQHD